MLTELTTITIRLMDENDLRRGFLSALSALKPTDLTEERALKVFQQREFAGVQTYVALAEDRVVGTASLLIEPKFIHDGGLVGHVEDVAVQEADQHHGIGAALVQHLVETCRREGCYKVILDCESEVVPFYEKLGFRRWEHAMRVDL